MKVMVAEETSPSVPVSAKASSEIQMRILHVTASDLELLPQGMGGGSGR